MKSSVATPVFIAVIVVAVLLIGFFGWKKVSASGTDNAAVADAAKSLNQGKPATEGLPPEQAHGDAMLMGGKKGRR